MSKKSNKENNNEPLVPPGEDQYLFGWNDAERLEKTKAGLARSFFNQANKTFFHQEYIKGFSEYLKQNVPEPETIDNIQQKELEKFIENMVRFGHLIKKNDKF